MTNHWNDIKNSDVIMIIGSNAAENHPISFRWVTKAMKNGAKLISVDPRFTRSSSKASIVDGIQLYSQMRSGTDIAFMMGMMRYAVTENRVNMEYVKSCTNASFLINSLFETCRDTSVTPAGIGTGTFSGLEASTAAHKQYAYDKATWAYQYDAPNDLKVDLGLGANTVWEAFVEQISAYDINTVCSITGADPTTLAKIYEVYTSTFADDQSACIMYAMGSTQHTYGTQNVRSFAMMQLLLGNVGVAGGGINALRGESNVQGSTDMCLLWHILPGYLAATTTAAKHATRAAYKDSYLTGKSAQDPDPLNDPVSLSWWRFGGKYIDSLLQAWWPLEHTGDTTLDTAYGYLPKAVAGTAYSHIDIFEAMDAGDIKGLMCWGQNPAVGGPSLGFERKALENLTWLVSVDLWETETARFWDGPGVDPATVNTVVYQLPAAASYEKEGSVTNSGRWSQWRYKAAEPPGQALDDLEIINRLAKKLISLYSPGTALADPVAKLHWGFYPGTDAHGVDGSSPNGYETAGHADPHKVAWEINGYWCPSSDKDGHRVDGFWGTATYSTLQENGLTSSGNWLYCSHYPDGENRQENVDPADNSACGIGLHSGWSYAWPLNRRIIYNGASVYQTGHANVGEPLAPHKFVLKYTSGGTVLEPGCDVPDGYKPPGAPGARYPFIMHREGHAHLYGPGRADGPFPEHYEPWETPLEDNPLGTDVLVTPTLHAHQRAWDHERADPGEFPIVATTYRLTEHWQAGQMTRNNPWLCELMPDAFVELSQDLADEKGIVNGDMVKITTKRTETYGSFMTAVACVTKRFKPYNVAGGTLHHIGVVWHYGFTGGCTGDSANLLTAHVGDANTGIPESKAFTCDIEKL